MIWQRSRVALLVGSVLAVAASSARADDCCAPAPCTQTVTCTEWVPEQFQTTRTVYRTEYRQEAYTAYRNECFPETKTRVCTVYKSIPEVKTVTNMVCERVQVCEDRTVMQSCVSYKPVTKVVRKCVDRGHYECREVPCEPSWRDRARKCFRKKSNDCCEPCCPPPTKTVRVWVPCPTWVEETVTCCERVCELRPVTCKVTCWKTVQRPVTCQVTCCKLVPVQETQCYTCMSVRQVAYQATRCVPVCTPHQETVTCCRMVARTVQKVVPAQTCCASNNNCGNDCGNSCCQASCGSAKKCGRKHSRNSGCCN